MKPDEQLQPWQRRILGRVVGVPRVMATPRRPDRDKTSMGAVLWLMEHVDGVVAGPSSLDQTRRVYDQVRCGLGVERQR